MHSSFLKVGTISYSNYYAQSIQVSEQQFFDSMMNSVNCVLFIYNSTNIVKLNKLDSQGKCIT